MTRVDTIPTHSFTGSISLLFNAHNKEHNKNYELTFLNSVMLQYIRHNYDLSFVSRLNIARDADGITNHNSFIVAGMGLEKYALLTNEKLTYKSMYFEPLIGFRSDSDKGLVYSSFAGVLFHPYDINYKKFNLRVGIGGVYQSAYWDMNNPNLRNESEEMQAKMAFINSRIDLKNNRYHFENSLHPMAMINLIYRPYKWFALTASSYARFYVNSPFDKYITREYPELKKCYPHVALFVKTYLNITTSLAFTTDLYWDSELSGMAVYKERYETQILLGLNWYFMKRLSD